MISFLFNRNKCSPCPHTPPVQASFFSRNKNPLLLTILFLIFLIPLIPLIPKPPTSLESTNTNLEGTDNIVFAGSTEVGSIYHISPIIVTFSHQDRKPLFSQVLTGGFISTSVQDNQSNIILSGATISPYFCSDNDIFIAKLNSETYSMDFFIDFTKNI